MSRRSNLPKSVKPISGAITRKSLERKLRGAGYKIDPERRSKRKLLEVVKDLFK